GILTGLGITRPGLAHLKRTLAAGLPSGIPRFFVGVLVAISSTRGSRQLLQHLRKRKASRAASGSGTQGSYPTIWQCPSADRSVLLAGSLACQGCHHSARALALVRTDSLIARAPRIFWSTSARCTPAEQTCFSSPSASRLTCTAAVKGLPSQRTTL